MKVKNVKKTVCAVLVGSSLVLGMPSATASGIPVIDGAAIAKMVEQAIVMKEQVDNQLKQINELKSQVKAVTGNRNLGNILKTEAYEQLPDEWKKVYRSAEKLKDGNYKDLLNSKGYNANADTERLSKQFDLTLRAIQDSEVRMKNIDKLMNQINQTNDIKAAQDLQNRIALENSKIQQNQTNLDMLYRYMELDEKVQMKKRAARDSCRRQNVIKDSNKACT